MAANSTDDLVEFGITLLAKAGYENLTMIRVVDKLISAPHNDTAFSRTHLVELGKFLATASHETAGTARIAAYITISVLTVIAVVLRIFSRLYRNQFIKLEDWMAVISLVFCLFTGVCFITFVGAGHDGTHVWDLTYSEIRVWVKILVASEFLFKFTNIPVKMTFLVFYYSLSPNKTFQRWVTGILTFAIMTVLYALIATVLQCRPVDFWNDVLDAKCMDRFAMYTVCGTFSILADVMILPLPLPVVWRLELRKKEKIILTFIFALGGFICVVAVVRLVALGKWLKAADMTYGNLTFVWTLIELDLGLIIACVPSLRALFMPQKSRKVSELRESSPDKPSSTNVTSYRNEETNASTTRESKVPDVHALGVVRLEKLEDEVESRVI